MKFALNRTEYQYLRTIYNVNLNRQPAYNVSWLLLGRLLSVNIDELRKFFRRDLRQSHRLIRQTSDGVELIEEGERAVIDFAEKMEGKVIGYLFSRFGESLSEVVDEETLGREMGLTDKRVVAFTLHDIHIKGIIGVTDLRQYHQTEKGILKAKSLINVRKELPEQRGINMVIHGGVHNSNLVAGQLQDAIVNQNSQNSEVKKYLGMTFSEIVTRCIFGAVLYAAIIAACRYFHWSDWRNIQDNILAAVVCQAVIFSTQLIFGRSK